MAEILVCNFLKYFRGICYGSAGNMHCLGDDEVAQLAKAFNGMASQLRADKEELEAKVEDRTGELKNDYEEIKAFSITDTLRLFQ